MEPKVAHLIAPNAVGGAESVVRVLAAGRHARLGRTEVIALVPQPASSPFVDALRDVEIPVSEVWGGSRRYVAEAAAVASVLKNISASIVHTHVYRADFVGYMAARRAGIAAVATYHGHVAGNWRNRAYEWADRYLLRRFDAVICVSRYNRSRLLRMGTPESKLPLIPNGLEPVQSLGRVEAREALGIPLDARVIGWVGRLSREKGLDLLLRSLSEADLAGARVVVIGDGPERKALSALASTNSAAHVEFVGERPNAATLLPAMDVLAISSRSEGSPMILLEAIRTETPVVAFGVGGIPQMLAPDSGWLIPPGDVAGFAAGLREALTDPAKARNRARRACQYADEEFGVDRWLDRVEQVYTEVLS